METSSKEERIRKITHLYYSRPEVQKAIFDFSKNREVCPRYFEGFGKRPDSLQYPRDVFEMVKKGATSFHCSEELWSNPLEIATGMSSASLNKLREGWDLLIDIDSKYIDYSKILAEQIIKLFEFHGIKNIGIKFSGSKGFHIIIPWKAFPKEINNVKTSDMFPEWPRAISKYIIDRTKEELTKKINELSYKEKYGEISKYIKREDVAANLLETIPSYKLNVASSGAITLKIEAIKQNENSWNKEVMPDIILVSPRHLFRAPYSLHEKTALASVVLERDELPEFDLKDADPSKIKIKNFMPSATEGEAGELLMHALDWSREHEKKETETKKIEYAPIKIDKLSDDFLPPTIKKILLGLDDGKKRALFVLINLFRSIGMEKEELEKRILEWNKKNKTPLNEGYITSQLLWSYRNKIVPPPNFDKDYYKGIGVIPNEEELRMKNPVNYVVKKSRLNYGKLNSNKQNIKDNFKK